MSYQLQPRANGNEVAFVMPNTRTPETCPTLAQVIEAAIREFPGKSFDQVSVVTSHSGDAVILAKKPEH